MYAGSHSLEKNMPVDAPSTVLSVVVCKGEMFE